jgi:predicted MFS family arabinose efflux permease
MDAKRRTTILINAASVLEKCEEQILPALYSRVGASFNATPTQLGNITLARSFMQALASPLAGIASHFMPRGTVICLGCCIWSTFTILFASTNSITTALPLCAINGIGLALVIPSVQSLTADYHAADSRGKAFGALWLTISFGGMLGALYATNVGALRPLGIDGWRFVFYSVAGCSIFVGILNLLYVHDPSYHQHQQTQYQQNHQHQQQQQQHGHLPPLQQHLNNTTTTTTGPKLNFALLKYTFLDIARVMRIPTFAIIIIQGIIGSVPYASLVFLTLYLQLLGMSDAAASGLVATYLIFGGFGGLLGGWIGDTVARRYPNHGRVAATQFSVASGIPFAFLIFKGLPLNGETATVCLYAVVIALFSLATAWPAPCANNPIFAEIVPVRLRNLVYAFDRCFEGAVAAFATPFVGRLSERYFGFSGTSAITGNPSIDIHNAQAMGNALLVFTVIPWAFCLVAYSGLHLTYPSDRRRAVMYDREKSLSSGSLVSLEYEHAVDGAGGSSSDTPSRGLRSSSLSLRQAGGLSSSSFEERMPLQSGNTTGNNSSSGGGGMNSA